MSEKEVYYGAVKWFSNSKGYGFIEPDNGTKDIFIHWSNVSMEGYKTLKTGDRVLYSTIEGDKGPNAVDVQVTDEAKE